MVVSIKREKVKKRIRDFRLMFFMMIALFILTISQLNSFTQFERLSEARYINLLYLTIFNLIVGCLAIGLNWWRMQREIRSMRTDHHITLNVEDLTLHNGHQQTAIPWSDIVKIKKSRLAEGAIILKLDKASQYERRTYRLQPIYELDQKRLYGEIDEAWQHGRDKLKT